MNIIFRPSFERDLRGIRDQTLSQRIQQAVAQVEAAPSLEAIASLVKMSGHTLLPHPRRRPQDWHRDRR